MIPVDVNQTKEWTFSKERHLGGGKTGCPCGAKRCKDEEDLPIPSATVLLIGPPSDRQRADILDAAAAMTSADEDGNRSISIRTGSLRRLRLRYGIRGVVRNFKGWETRPDPFGDDRPIPSDRFLETIPDSAAVELDEDIAGLTDVSEDEVGKYEPQSVGSGKSGPGTSAATAVG